LTVPFNLHRVKGRRHLVVVEGFFGAIALHQLDVPTVALMGRSLSEYQIELLRQAGAQYLTFLLDGDEAGRSAAHAIMDRLAREPFRVKFALLPEGEQPDTVDEAFLRQLLGLKA
jgi:DNA primase